MKEVVSDAGIIDAMRTPLVKGRLGGALAGVHPVDRLAHPLAALVERTGIDPRVIDDVIVGCVSRIDGAKMGQRVSPFFDPRRPAGRIFTGARRRVR